MKVKEKVKEKAIILCQQREEDHRRVGTISVNAKSTIHST